MPHPPIGGIPWVQLTIWGVAPRHVPRALARMALDRRLVRAGHPSTAGLRFAKLLGTGSGQTFTARDADLLHWAVLTVWDRPGDAAAFAAGPLHQAWQRLATEQLTVQMVPGISRGEWSRQRPFASSAGLDGAVTAQGPVAAITRARLRLTRAPGFWRSVPPVAAELGLAGGANGLRLAVGIGESPIGLQGTFSLWDDQAALARFAYSSPAHVGVVRRTAPERWYAEELFARFAVRSVTGSYRGEALSALTDDPTAPTNGRDGGVDDGVGGLADRPPSA